MSGILFFIFASCHPLSMLCNKNKHGKMKDAVFFFVYRILILNFVYLVGYILHIFIPYCKMMSVKSSLRRYVLLSLYEL